VALSSSDAVKVIVALLFSALGFYVIGAVTGDSMGATLAFGAVTAAAALASPAASGSIRSGVTVPPPLGGTVTGELPEMQTPRGRRRTPARGVRVGEGGKSPPGGGGEV